MYSELTPWNVIVAVLLVVVVLVPIAALFSVWRWRSNMETTHVLIWALIIIAAPFLGAFGWFAAGKTLHPAR